MTSAVSFTSITTLAEAVRSNASLAVARAANAASTFSKFICNHVIARRALECKRSLTTRTQIHHLYFALAIFDLIAVGIGLYLNHHLNQTLANSIKINTSLNRTFLDIDELRRSVNVVVAIGHSVAFGKSTPQELDSFETVTDLAHQKLDQFRPSLLQFASEFESFLKPDSGLADALMRSTNVLNAGKATTVRTAVALDLYARKEMAEAAIGSIEFSQLHHRFMIEADHLSRVLRQVERELQDAQLAEGLKMQRLEYLIGIMMVLMVCGVTFYGHNLGKSFQRKHEELALAHRTATAAEAETRILNQDIVVLNTDLEKSLQQLKDAQVEIVRKGRLAQLGQLTATVAHEIRNPLGAVKTSVQLIERKLQKQEHGLEKAFGRINNGVARCDQIITELLDFTRSKSLNLKMHRIDAWIAAIVEEEGKELPQNVSVVLLPGLDEIEAAFDVDRMRRVLVNLLSNASEAMVGKGNVKLQSQTAHPKIEVTTRLLDGNIEISVQDNGPGIPEDVVRKIMEPLFTTKSFGVGLGLPAVEKALEQHGGGLKIDGRPGEGAIFTAWFPLVTLESKPIAREAARA